eukprot:3379579-Amphidinium_carterae.1
MPTPRGCQRWCDPPDLQGVLATTYPVGGTSTCTTHTYRTPHTPALFVLYDFHHAQELSVDTRRMHT